MTHESTAAWKELLATVGELDRSFLEGDEAASGAAWARRWSKPTGGLTPKTREERFARRRPDGFAYRETVRASSLR